MISKLCNTCGVIGKISRYAQCELCGSHWTGSYWTPKKTAIANKQIDDLCIDAIRSVDRNWKHVTKDVISFRLKVIGAVKQALLKTYGYIRTDVVTNIYDHPFDFEHTKFPNVSMFKADGYIQFIVSIDGTLLNSKRIKISEALREQENEMDSKPCKYHYRFFAMCSDCVRANSKRNKMTREQELEKLLEEKQKIIDAQQKLIDQSYASRLNPPQDTCVHEYPEGPYHCIIPPGCKKCGKLPNTPTWSCGSGAVHPQKDGWFTSTTVTSSVPLDAEASAAVTEILKDATSLIDKMFGK